MSDIERASQDAVRAAEQAQQFAMVLAAVTAAQQAQQQAPACQHAHPPAAPSGGNAKWVALAVCAPAVLLAVAVSAVAVAVSAVSLAVLALVLRSVWRDIRKG